MIVGVDIGGTFTDLVSFRDGRLTTEKVPSTPTDFAEGFRHALDAAEATAADEIVHATTVATNALIQRKGATAGMVTTRGFRDVLELRRRDRRTVYGIETAFRPLIPRAFRREVTERSGPDGVITPVDLEAVVAEAVDLVSAGAEAILVAFLHSVTCPDNEDAAAAAIIDAFPDLPVFASHRVTDVRAEFERFSTGAASVFVGPLVSGYVAGVAARLDEPDSLRIVTSDGGLADTAAVRANPVRTALSGPAAGVRGAVAVCGEAGIDAFVTCDVGGTSFDACLVTGGSPALTRERSLGFGLPLAVEMLDIATIGAGGGSVVRVSPVGVVEVGPDGVGADPGPACYGRQSHLATVTDADLLLGRLSPALRLPSGTRDLDVEAARTTMNDRVARPIGVSVEAAAALVVSTVEEKMADQIRQVALSRRVDVTEHALFAYGGAGPVHAAGIAEALGISRVLVPPNAGMFSAWGGLLAQDRRSLSTPCDFPLGDGRLDDLLRSQVQALGDTGERLHAVDLLVDAVRTVTLPVLLEEPTTKMEARLAEACGYAPDIVRVRRVATVTTVSNGRALSEVSLRVSGGEGEDAGKRPVAFGNDEPVETPVIDRSRLGEGDAGEGPCVIEEAGATTVVPPAFSWRVGPRLLLHLERRP